MELSEIVSYLTLSLILLIIIIKFFEGAKKKDSGSLNSDEYERLIKRILDIESNDTKNLKRYNDIEAQIQALETKMNSLRGFVNKKFGDAVNENDEEKEGNGLGMQVPLMLR